MSTFTVYHKDYCPYCRAAKELLASLGWDYRAIEVSEDPALLDKMVARSGRRTVPQIFLGDVHIGGFEELQAYVRRTGGHLRSA